MRIGLDLGTTNTVVATGGATRVVGSEAKTILPSVVAYPPNKKTLVGSKARLRRAIDPTNTIYSSKRIIGRRFGAAVTQDFDARYPFTLAERDEQPVFVTRAGEFSPEDIGATIVGHALEEAHDLELSATSTLVVAVPAAFGPAQRASTTEVAKRAGVSRIELIDEPVATTRAFNRFSSLPAGPVAVFDLGGGTFELAIVSAGEVVGTASDLYLGGDDIDRALANLVADEILSSHRWDLRDNPIVYDRLVFACEGAKRGLSAQRSIVLSLSTVDPALPDPARSLSLTRDQLDSVVAPIVRRTFLLCDEALAGASIDRDRLSAVLLAGGSSQLPIVSDMVSQYFGVSPGSSPSPMELVAIGASIA